MKLKLTVEHGSEARDIVLVADSTATVQAVAERIRFRLFGPDAPPAPEGLVINRASPGERIAAADATLSEAGLRSGDRVALSTAGADGRPARAPVGTLSVLSGPDAPQQFPIHRGTNFIGRDRSADVRLSDPRVSKRHAKLNISDTIEIVDDRSANGVLLGGAAVDRAVVRPGTPITLGDTVVTITVHTLGGAVEAEGAVAFNRSPRLDPDYVGVELKAPEPPRPSDPHRFPILSLLAPVVMAGLLYAVTRNTMSLLFIAFSPLLMVGSWMEGRMAARKADAAALDAYRSALVALSVQLQYASDLERDGRRAEHPSVGEIEEAIRDLTELVWTRRPEHERFLQFRVGLGTHPSRNEVELPTTNNTAPELWQELLDVVGRFSVIDRVPVVADLRAAGNVGVAGADQVARPVVANVLAQLCALHSPAELVLAAVAGENATAWDWVKWLPHTGSEFSPVAGAHLAANAAEANALVTSIEGVLDERSASDAEVHLPAVVVFVDDDAPVERARLVQIAERGPAVGVHIVWHAPSVQRLPAACRLFLDIDAEGRHRAGYVHGGVAVTDLEPEVLSPAAALALAKRLAPVVDSGVRADDQSDLPHSVSFLDLVGLDVASNPDAVVDNWRANNALPPVAGARPSKRDNTLRAVVGQSATGVLHLDLRTQGPHALVGGTTGAGKSEFLQSWVLGMAAAHSPSRVTFLFVDYKGGSAFAECTQLPHCVGLVTDLTPHLVRRAISSLRAELRHRERILRAAKAKDLLEMERNNDPAAPPSLVIVVDEFAALAQEVPEFVEGVVDVAQRGRSLGLNLILATQRPGGVIKDNLRANTNLRVALRVADEEDSNDVVGVKLAATFDPGLPGRAVVKTGPTRLTTFQSAYAGGRTTGEAPPAHIEVRDLVFGTGDEWDSPAEPESEPVAEEREAPTDIARIVGNIGAAAKQAGIPRPRKPWLPVLPATFKLEDLPTSRTDRELVFGVIDRPEEQTQQTVAFVPDRDGNMAVFGTSGSGKSTFLRTIAIAAGFAPARGGPCYVYGLDFGTRGLTMLEALPHVGAIIGGDDGERTLRLLTMLRDTIDERAVRYNAADAGTITEYRAKARRPDEPRILLLIDNFGAFRQMYEVSSNARVYEMLESIAADGRGVGVHIVATADQATAFSAGINSVIQSRLALRLSSEMDLSMLGVPLDVFSETTPAGRGVMGGAEVQVAVLAGDPNMAKQAAAQRELAVAMARAGVPEAPPIGRLAEHIPASSIAQRPDAEPLLGVWDETLEPIGFDPSGVFVVTGPPHSGKTTTIVTMLRSLELARGGREYVLIGSARSALAQAAPWREHAMLSDQIAELCARLSGELRDGKHDAGDLVVVIEDVDAVSDGIVDDDVAELLKVCRASGAFVIASGETATFHSSYGLVAATKLDRQGVVLQPDDSDGDIVFNVPFPRASRADFPPGRGVLVRAGRARRVQVLYPEASAW